jgi:hypothetical protein
MNAKRPVTPLPLLMESRGRAICATSVLRQNPRKRKSVHRKRVLPIINIVAGSFALAALIFSYS